MKKLQLVYSLLFLGDWRTEIKPLDCPQPIGVCWLLLVWLVGQREHSWLDVRVVPTDVPKVAAPNLGRKDFILTVAGEL